MNISSNKRSVAVSAYLGAAVYGLIIVAAPVGAQNATAPAMSQSDSIVSATQDRGSVTDEELRKRVQVALHSDPYFYDEHVSVSVENHVVMLRGFVFSDWDLRNAIRIASKAADGRRVVENLSLKMDGR
jgi:osmotically-inducible protein OsmY